MLQLADDMTPGSSFWQVLVDGMHGLAYHEVTFDGSGLGSGVYFYRLSTRDFVVTKRLLLLR